MLTDQQYIELLELAYPEETITVGATAVEGLVKDHQQYKAAGGNDFDVAASLVMLSTGLTIIKTSIEIYKSLKPTDQNESGLLAKAEPAIKQKGIKLTLKELTEVVKIIVEFLHHA